MFTTAIIGCGSNIAGGYDRSVPAEWSATHAGAYHLCPETRLVAVADTDLDKLKTFQDKWHIGRGYTDYVEMLEKEKIDILSLCLPTEHHFGAFQSAIDNNIKAIFCEKPLSHDINEANRMREIGQRTVVAVNYFRRWNPTLVKIVDAIHGGTWGKVINITVRYTKGLFVNGSHFIDVVRWICGEPSKIDLIKITDHNLVDPGADFLLTFDNGATVYFLNLPELGYVFADVDIILERGRVVMAQRGQRLIKYAVVHEPYYDLFDIIGDPYEEETEWRNCTTRAVKEIAACLRHGGNPACTMNDGYRATEICHKLVMQRGRNV